MMTVRLDAVFKPFFKIVHDRDQQLTINWANFLTDGFLQIIQRTGFMSVNTRFQIPPKKKSHIERSGERGGHSTSPKWEMRCIVHKHAVLNRPSLHCYWSCQPRGKECRPPRPPPSAYILSTTHSKDVGFLWVTLYTSKCQSWSWIAVVSGLQCWWMSYRNPNIKLCFISNASF